jgi:hypothetical protein
MQPSNEGVIAERGESVDGWSSLSTNQVDGVARRETHLHERSSHHDARSVEPLGAMDKHPSRSHERGDEQGQLAHCRVDVITVVHREAHIEAAERYGRCPGRLPVLEIDDHVDVKSAVLRTGVQLVAMDKAGTTSNTCIFQPAGAGIGSPRIFEELTGSWGWLIAVGAGVAEYGRPSGTDRYDPDRGCIASMGQRDGSRSGVVNPTPRTG